MLIYVETGKKENCLLEASYTKGGNELQKNAFMYNGDKGIVNYLFYQCTTIKSDGFTFRVGEISNHGPSGRFNHRIGGSLKCSIHANLSCHI